LLDDNLVHIQLLPLVHPQCFRSENIFSTFQYSRIFVDLRILLFYVIDMNVVSLFIDLSFYF